MEITEADLYLKLKQFFGFDAFKGEQQEIITHLINGKSAFVLMPTGGGKSLCYQLPALCLPGTAIVISPLIALMKNQVDAMRGYIHNQEGIAHFLNSSLNKGQIQEVKDDLMNGITKLLYVAPESLTKEENIEFLKNIPISFYAIDEAHCISEWGHDFRPEYRKINQIVKKIGEAPIIALTATATPKVQSDIQRNLELEDARVFKSSFNRPNLFYEIREKINPKRDIIKYLKEHPGESGIIYCLSRKKVEEISELLNINGIKSLPYHAGLDASVRAANQDKFLMEQIDVIVATIAFGMGIDKPDVRFVIHYDMPKSLEGYYQETGRAGRDGKDGRCIAFYSYKDIQKLEKFMQGKPVSEQEVGKQLLNETVSYAETTQCRRKVLLNYFGEQYSESNCECCDNCIHPKIQFDGKDDLLTVMELIRSLKETFKTEYIANILTGVNNSIIKSYNHSRHEMFGIGKDKGVKYWTSIIRQGVLAHLLEKDLERYGAITITDEGTAFYEHPFSIMMSEDRTFSDNLDDEEDDQNQSIGKKVGGGGGDLTLLAMLKDLRKDMARKKNLPAWVLFTDPSLEDMSIQYPITLDDLKNCQGIGEGKAKKFGEPFIELIAKYVEENDIDRPDDFIVKSIVNKSANKVYVIQSIDKRIPFEDIAQSKDLTMDELLEEIESIISSGTRLNIDYYIKQVVDEDNLADIYDYLKEESTSDSLNDILKGLGSNYPEDEVRLVRIKFISEMGN